MSLCKLLKLRSDHTDSVSVDLHYRRLDGDGVAFSSDHNCGLYIRIRRHDRARSVFGPLMMIVHPAPIAAAILRIAWLNGKFQGVNAAQTPIGSRSTIWRTFENRGGITRP
jgi:hypothetical protein